MDTSMEIVRVEQLPVITERLHEIKEALEKEGAELAALECTDETLNIVKAKRAEFNKKFNEWDRKRIDVKKIALAPVDAFEEEFKKCVTEPSKKFLGIVDGKIASVTVKRTKEKILKAKEHFGNVCGIDWLEFDRLGIKINMSDSDSKIFKAIDEAVAKVNADLKLIAASEYSDEVLYEYKKSLNAINAVVNVTERHKALEAAPVLENKPAAMSDDDILDAVMADMAVPKMVVFEKPKREYNFKFYLDEDEYAELLAVIIKFDYREEK